MEPPWEGVEGWRGVRDEPHVDLVYPAAGSQQVPIQSLGVAGRSLPTIFYKSFTNAKADEQEGNNNRNRDTTT